MLIQAWNIQAGGGTRLTRIFEEILREGADTVVLGETTQHRLSDLKTGLRKLGFTSIHAPNPPERRRGVLIASKSSFVKKTHSANEDIETHRWAEVWFPKERVRLAGLYFPDTARPIMAMWPRVLEAATRRRDERKAPRVSHRSCFWDRRRSAARATSPVCARGAIKINFGSLGVNAGLTLRQRRALTSIASSKRPTSRARYHSRARARD